jgi:hypothetical protein
MPFRLDCVMHPILSAKVLAALAKGHRIDRKPVREASRQTFFDLIARILARDLGHASLDNVALPAKGMLVLSRLSAHFDFP